MSSNAEHAAVLKPPGTREFTVRAVVTSVLVSALIGAAYPYVVLKLGFGPNISVVSAFFGFLALGSACRDFNRWENNIVQSAGTTAGGTAFLCVLLAAFDMLGADTALAFRVNPTPMRAFLWLTVAGLLGVFLAVPMRQHFVVKEKLVYADGVAAGETLIVLDSKGPGSKSAARDGAGRRALRGGLRDPRGRPAAGSGLVPAPRDAAAQHPRRQAERRHQLEPAQSCR